MDQTFTAVNTMTIALCALVLAIVWIRWFLRRKKRAT